MSDEDLLPSKISPIFFSHTIPLFSINFGTNVLSGLSDFNAMSYRRSFTLAILAPGRSGMDLFFKKKLTRDDICLVVIF